MIRIYRSASGLLLGLLFCFCVAQPVLAQDSVVKKKNRNNVVRVNITNPVLFSSSSVLLGYERVVWKNQSISLNLGHLGFGKFFFAYPSDGNSRLQINQSYNDKGYHGSLDYRFYLKKENKYPAPRGVYLAPYFSFNYFQRTTSWTLNSKAFTGDFSTTFTMKMNTVGGELGYQFILWKRVAIDLILIGPGISRYYFSTKFSTGLDTDDEHQVLESLFANLKDRIVGLGWVMDGDQFVKSGSTNTTAIGFRYMVHVGFCF